jgi:hypothetical protein
MVLVNSPTHTVTIYVAGDIASAKQAIRKHCYNYGACFTVTPTDFIYTGGEESGIAIGLVNYPRFPVTLDELKETAHRLVLALLPVLNQKSALIVAPDQTTWVTQEPPGAL